MPRPAKNDHPVRRLRAILGMSQSVFGDLVGVAGGTIESVENGRLSISKKLARRIHYATGADFRELLKGPAGKLLNRRRRKFQIADYTAWKREFVNSPRDVVELFVSLVTPRIKFVLVAAAKQGRFGTAYCEIAEAVESAAERIEQRLEKRS